MMIGTRYITIETMYLVEHRTTSFDVSYVAVHNLDSLASSLGVESRRASTMFLNNRERGEQFSPASS